MLKRHLFFVAALTRVMKNYVALIRKNNYVLSGIATIGLLLCHSLVLQQFYSASCHHSHCIKPDRNNNASCLSC